MKTKKTHLKKAYISHSSQLLYKNRVQIQQIQIKMIIKIVKQLFLIHTNKNKSLVKCCENLKLVLS